LPRLEALNLEQNGGTLGGSIPIEIGQSSTLKFLVLNGNAFRSTIPSEIGRVRNLRDILLRNNAVSLPGCTVRDTMESRL
jgi:hypothetical protein